MAFTTLALPLRPLLPHYETPFCSCLHKPTNLILLSFIKSFAFFFLEQIKGKVVHQDKTTSLLSFSLLIGWISINAKHIRLLSFPTLPPIKAYLHCPLSSFPLHQITQAVVQSIATSSSSRVSKILYSTSLKV